MLYIPGNIMAWLANALRELEWEIEDRWREQRRIINERYREDMLRAEYEHDAQMAALMPRLVARTLPKS